MANKLPNFTASLAWLAVLAAVSLAVLKVWQPGRGRTPPLLASRSSHETAFDGGDPSEQGEEDTTEQAVSGQELVRAAAVRLQSRTALDAKVRQRVDMFGQQLTGSGRYQQWGAGPATRLRMELKFQVADQVASLHQVSDGRFFWTRRDFPGQSSLSRIDLRIVYDVLEQRAEELRAKLKASGGADGDASGQGGGSGQGSASGSSGAGRLASSASSPSVPAPSDGSGRLDVQAPAFQQWLPLGGLARLLTVLDEHFEFGVAEPRSLHDTPVWRIVGRWRPAALERIAPGLASRGATGRPIKLDSLPAHLPDIVVLVLGRDERIPLFPYRVEYRRHRDGEYPLITGVSEGGTPVSLAGTFELAVLELFEVNPAPTLTAQDFVYNPGEQQREVVDETDRFLGRLR